MTQLLIVDDDPMIRMLLKRVAERAGIAADTAADGAEALERLRERHYRVLLLDLMMPRMSGYDVLEKIRAMPSRAATPVIVVTAKHDPEGVQREVEGGATDHLAKPFLPSELEAVVKRVLKGPKKATEQARRALERSADLYGTVKELHQRARDVD